MAGVVPVIFASSLLYIPALIAQFNQPQAGETPPAWVVWIHAIPRPRRSPALHARCTSCSSSGFTYFYVAITFNPVEVADNMKKYGGFIPGIRAGRPTAEYLDYVLTRITLPGSIYLGFIALLPAHRPRGGRRQPELPVRRRVDPHHRRCRSRDGEADRRPAAAASLRRTPAMTAGRQAHARSACSSSDRRAPARARRASASREAFGIPAISTGDVFRARGRGRQRARPAGARRSSRPATSCPTS